MKFYLRIEGVNLNNFVYETADLSTIRGGGLLLLDAVTYVQDKIKEKLGLKVEPISTGASSGLFAIDTDEATAKDLSEKVESYLNDDSKYRHATFVVDVLPATGDFIKDRESLIALNRWRQMTSPQVAVPQYNTAHSRVCELDFVRPSRSVGKRARKASESVTQRRTYGRRKRQDFMFDLVGNSVRRNFARDFDEITSNRSKGNLHRKMAVIYIDGNGFGKIQNDFCKDDIAQKKFDDEIKAYRTTWAVELVNQMNADEANWLSPHKGYQLEIIMWGGDENCFVVPAWKGWETLNLLFEKSKSWEFKNQRLTHAAGVVFCHHNAPIRRVKKLAEDLANQAKQNRKQNRFAYEILESFDHIGRGLEDYRKERCPQPDADDKSLILSGEKMGEAINQMKQIKDEAIPRRKLVKLVQLLLRKRDTTNDLEKMQSEEDEIMQEILKQAKQENEGNIRRIISCFGGDADWWLNQFKPLNKDTGDEEKQERAEERKQAKLTWWVHLNALWDYID